MLSVDLKLCFFLRMLSKYQTLLQGLPTCDGFLHATN